MQYPDLDQEKRRLRSLAAETVRAQAADSLTEAGKRITGRVLSSSLYRQAASVFVYVSTAREPDTRALIENAWRTGKTVYVPKCYGKGRMEAVRAGAWRDLAPGALGILEPSAAAASGPFPPIDLAIVPCVCASRDGMRLGHGAGYYDRFLRAHPMPCICLCFHALLMDRVPAGALDMPMDAVVTEEGWFSSFSGQKGQEAL